MTQSERQVISDLARLGLLDEVINVILLFTFNKVASANLNEKYALKVGNDFAYEGIKNGRGGCPEDPPAPRLSYTKSKRESN